MPRRPHYPDPKVKFGWNRRDAGVSFSFDVGNVILRHVSRDVGLSVKYFPRQSPNMIDVILCSAII